MDQEKAIDQEKASQLQTRPKIPPLPPWPTSKRGPLVTEPPPGQKRMPLRTEQVAEIGYDQERGVPGVPIQERLMSESDQGVQGA